MRAPVRAFVTEVLGAEIEDVRAVGGGDINEAWALTFSDGRRAFAKTHPGAAPTMFPREADGLDWLREPGALRVPEVLAVSEDVLVLELLSPGRAAPDHDARLGRGLAAIHAAGADGFGGPSDNFIGDLPQDNRREPDWATFYRARRLEPQLARAADRGLVSRAMRDRFARLFAQLEELVGDPEPPARLHGDLWGGNCFTDDAGAPVLIDPAVYGGHREVDLAMMRLFGGFSPTVFAAYEEASPLSPGADARVPLYQLYPLMVHVNLFGGGYVSSVERALAALV